MLLLPRNFYLTLCVFITGTSIISSQDTSDVDVGLTLLNVHKWLTPEALNVTSILQCVSSRGEDVSFNRVLDTGNGLVMPTGMSHRSPTSGLIRELQSENGASRFGAYYCQAEPSSTKIVAFKLPPESKAELKAEKMYLTVRASEEVNMLVIRERREDSVGQVVRWRHNGILLPGWDNSFNGTLFKASPNDSGIYECYHEGKRAEGLHALFKVYVYRCPEGKYGPNCESDCPPCYNGGVCEENSGKCICPPGFRGANCQIPCGPNAFGLNCSHVCYPHEAYTSSAEVRDSCAFYWFCLPDPYGCTCGAGFRGHLCTDYCETGTYGVDCSQKCHCTDASIPCDPVTGECGSSGGCAEGWTGMSCQIREPPSLKMAPVLRDLNSSAIYLSWDHWTFGNDSGGWPDTQPEYMLFLWNTTHDIPIWPTSRNITEFWVTGLDPNTEYRFSIETSDALRRWRPQGEEKLVPKRSPLLEVTTHCGPFTERSVPRNFTARIVESDAIHVSWEPPAPQDLQCDLEGFILSWWITSAPQKIYTFKARSEKVAHKLSNLKKNTTYTLKLVVNTKNASAILGAEIVVTTPPEELPAVKELTAVYQYGLLHVAWEAPKLREKGTVVLQYHVQLFLLNLNACQALPQQPEPLSHFVKVTEIQIPDLLPYATYEISVTPNISKGVNGRAVAIVQNIPEAAPSTAPEILSAHYANETALAFSWNPLPCQHMNSNPSEVNYEWTFKGIVSEDEENAKEFKGTLNSKELGQKNTYVAFVDGVAPKSEYLFLVKAFSTFGDGPEANISRSLSELGESLSLDILDQTSNSLLLQVHDTADAATASTYQISICEEASSAQNLLGCQLAIVEYRPGVLEYESMQHLQVNLTESTNYTCKVQRMTKYGTWGPWSKTFIFSTLPGNDEDLVEAVGGGSGSVDNASEIVAPDERDVVIAAAAESSKESERASVSCGILILIVIAALLVLILIIAVAIYYYRRRKSRHCRFVVKGDKSCKRTSAEVAPLNASSEKSVQGLTKESSFKEVSLNSVPERSSTLICDGFINKGEFILTKMPAESKQESFWSKVYSQNSSVIVMLNDSEFIDDTMAVPGQYWPHGDSFSRQFGRFTVDVVQTEEKGRVNIRTMRVRDTQQGDGESLGVVQLQYLDDWDNEKGVPKSCTSFMGLVLLALAQKQKRGGTIAIHCQDGETRSGLFCVCCFLKQESDFGGRGDVMRAVRHFQTQRRPVLENEEQLRFGLELAELLASDEPKLTVKHSHTSAETFV